MHAVFPSKAELSTFNFGKIRQLDQLARARGQSLAQMSLAWVLRSPVITSALIGASKVSQLQENVATVKNIAFSDSELSQIERIIAG